METIFAFFESFHVVAQAEFLATLFAIGAISLIWRQFEIGTLVAAGYLIYSIKLGPLAQMGTQNLDPVFQSMMNMMVPIVIISTAGFFVISRLTQMNR